MKAKTYEYNGQQYTLVQLSKLSGKSISCIRSRLIKGMSVDKAVKHPNMNEKKHTCIYQGREIGITEASKILGISRDTIYHRLFRGSTLQEIIDDPRTGAHKKYEFGNRLFSPGDIADLAEISTAAVQARLKKGESISSIITRGNIQNKKKYLYKGKYYSFNELTKLPECIVNINTLRSRLDRFYWDVEKAIITPPSKRTTTVIN